MKTGQIIKHKGNTTDYKIIEIFGGLIAIMPVEDRVELIYWYTKSYIEEHFDIPVEVWSPAMREDYFFIGSDGSVNESYWDNHQTEKDCKDFLGVFKTREEAKARLEEIKRLLKK